MTRTPRSFRTVHRPPPRRPLRHRTRRTPADSPLCTLPNVLLTPHIAGSLGTEPGRMTEWAVDELARYACGLPFAHPVGPEELTRSA